MIPFLSVHFKYRQCLSHYHEPESERATLQVWRYIYFTIWHTISIICLNFKAHNISIKLFFFDFSMSPLQVWPCLVPVVLITVVMSSREKHLHAVTQFKSVNTNQRLRQKNTNRVDGSKNVTPTVPRLFDTFLRKGRLYRTVQDNRLSVTTQDCSNVCNLRDRQIECIDCVPSKLPSEVTEVILMQFSVDRIVPYMFCVVSWPSVVNLTILNSNGVSLSISNFTFDCLPQIETLRLGLSSLESLDINAFHGLENTTTLDLADSVMLNTTMLTPSLSLYTNLPKLRNLILRRLGTKTYTGVNQFSQEQVDIVANRKIVEIDFSFSAIGFANDHVNIEGMCKCAEKLIIRHSRLMNIKFEFPSACESLRVLDLTGVSFPSLPIPVGNITLVQGVYKLGEKWMMALSNVSLIYLNNLISSDHFIYLNNITFELQIENSLKEVHFSGYNMPAFGVNILLKSNLLEYLDLSANRIERLSPDSFSSLTNLKIIELSNNNLDASKQNKQMFSNLFRNNSKLEIVKLAHNELTDLPSNIFELNMELKRIDLSVNKITQITFEISHLNKFEVLDLRGNNIEYLNSWSMHQIDMLYKHKKEERNTTYHNAFTVDIRDNLFSCKCHSMDFINWFVNSPVFNDSRDLYFCKVDDKIIHMDKGAIEAAQYDCGKPMRKIQRLLLIVLLPSVSTGMLVTLAIVAFRRYKRHRLYRRLREHIGLIHEDHFQPRFPVFLSYASEDSEFVEGNIRRPLEVSSVVTK